MAGGDSLPPGGGDEGRVNRGIRPGVRQATLLRHRHHGPEHLDLVIANGANCLTMRLAGKIWRWQAAHRRRYLTYSGPISKDRGSVRVLWRGTALIRQHNIFLTLVLCPPPPGWLLSPATWRLAPDP